MKHRKKQNTTQTKQEEQHQRNLFYKKLQHTMALLGDASAIALLDKKKLEFIHHYRIRPHRIIAQNNSKQKSLAMVLDMLNKSLNDQLHKTFIDVGEKKIRFNLTDFTVYVETLYIYWLAIEEKCSETESRFKACFPLFYDNFTEIRAHASLEVKQKLDAVAWLYSDITKQTIRFVTEKINRSSATSTSEFYNNYIMTENEPETETLEIDGHKRTIYRVVATTAEAFTPLTITPERLGMNGIMQKYPLKVFIQMHAFERIEMRLGKLFRMFHYPYIIAALLKADPIPADEKNSFLFPVTNLTARLGYLKADVTGDKLVVRTFLFVTNNGTPEGKKLNHLIGLQKADKKYLGIDKLSTFIQSDIKKDEKLKDLFCEAGCGNLFNLSKTLLDDPGDKELVTAEFISHYLGI
jgi:hypothetical protein